MPKVDCDIYSCYYNIDGYCDAEKIRIDDCGECWTKDYTYIEIEQEANEDAET